MRWPLSIDAATPTGRCQTAAKHYLNNSWKPPDQCLWERARGLIIRAVPIVTLENAVRSVRKCRDAGQVPDPFTLYRAVRYAVDYDTSGVVAGRGGICR